jgi:pimeloyl-ACP methyl ester carboxylesterase
MDGFVWNARHCSVVGPSTCEEEPAEHRKICTPCDQSLPWEKHGIDPARVHDITVKAEDGTENEAYFIEAEGGPSRVTIAYHHGNFGGIEHYLPRVALLAQLDVNVFPFSVRGFGKSSVETEASYDETLMDMRAAIPALHQAMADHGAADPIHVVYGYSMGTQVMAPFADEDTPCLAIFEAPVPSTAAISDDSTHIGVPPSFFTTGKWDAIPHIENLKSPVFIIHGKDDDFIRYEFGEAVFEAAPEPKRFWGVEGAGHGAGPSGIPENVGENVYLNEVKTALIHYGCLF